MGDDEIPRSNFDSFWRALITVFQVKQCVACILVSTQTEAMRHVVEAVAQNQTEFYSLSNDVVYCAYRQLSWRKIL